MALKLKYRVCKELIPVLSSLPLGRIICNQCYDKKQKKPSKIKDLRKKIEAMTFTEKMAYSLLLMGAGSIMIGLQARYWAIITIPLVIFATLAYFKEKDSLQCVTMGVGKK